MKSWNVRWIKPAFPMRPTHDGPKDQRCVVQPLDDLQGRWMYTIFIHIYILYSAHINILYIYAMSAM